MFLSTETSLQADTPMIKSPRQGLILGMDMANPGTTSARRREVYAAMSVCMYLHMPPLPWLLIVGRVNVRVWGRGCTHMGESTQIAMARILKVISIIATLSFKPSGPKVICFLT